MYRFQKQQQTDSHRFLRMQRLLQTQLLVRMNALMDFLFLGRIIL
jgi:hypothetical protein